jgi:hypothetical protein
LLEFYSLLDRPPLRALQSAIDCAVKAHPLTPLSRGSWRTPRRGVPISTRRNLRRMWRPFAPTPRSAGATTCRPRVATTPADLRSNESATTFGSERTGTHRLPRP